MAGRRSSGPGSPAPCLHRRLAPLGKRPGSLGPAGSRNRRVRPGSAGSPARSAARPSSPPAAGSASRCRWRRASCHFWRFRRWGRSGSRRSPPSWSASSTSSWPRGSRSGIFPSLASAALPRARPAQGDRHRTSSGWRSTSWRRASPCWPSPGCCGGSSAPPGAAIWPPPAPPASMPRRSSPSPARSPGGGSPPCCSAPWASAPPRSPCAAAPC